WGAGPGSSRAVVGGLVPCVAGARARAGRASCDGPCGWGAALGLSCVVGGPVPCVAGVRAGPAGCRVTASGAGEPPGGRPAVDGPRRAWLDRGPGAGARVR